MTDDEDVSDPAAAPARDTDPQPRTIPDLEPGGGVSPGATPPESAQTSGLSHPQPHRVRRFPTAGIGTLIGICVLVAAMIIVIVGLVVMLS